MKVSVLLYIPPEGENLTLGVIEGASLAKAKKVALELLKDDDDSIDTRLITAKASLIVEERYFTDDGEWTEWAESGAIVSLETHQLTK